MITEAVIKEIYKKYGKKAKQSDWDLDYFIDLLSPHHTLEVADDGELIIANLEEFNPFRRFLMRSINVMLEFDKMVAIVFSNHIIFLNKDNSDIHVHFRPEEKGFFQRLFGK